MNLCLLHHVIRVHVNRTFFVLVHRYETDIVGLSLHFTLAQFADMYVTLLCIKCTSKKSLFTGIFVHFSITTRNMLIHAHYEHLFIVYICTVPKARPSYSEWGKREACTYHVLLIQPSPSVATFRVLRQLPFLSPMSGPFFLTSDKQISSHKLLSPTPSVQFLSIYHFLPVQQCIHSQTVHRAFTESANR